MCVIDKCLRPCMRPFQIMEIVGGIASATQLVVYSQAVAQRLVQLYKAAQEGPVFCRTQRFNIRILLESIQRLCLQEAPDNDSILPLLIATENTATWLLNLLEPKGTFYNCWLWVSKGPEIESAFRALNDKTRLLQLHITERTYNIVAHVREDIKNMNKNINDRPCKITESVSASPYPQKRHLILLTYLFLSSSSLRPRTSHLQRNHPTIPQLLQLNGHQARPLTKTSNYRRKLRQTGI